MGKPLAARLADAGWFCAMYTIEATGGKNYPPMTIVYRGSKLTWDTNMGVVVVHDESGWPWIAQKSENAVSFVAELVKEFGLTRGARVPHSNDGGYFIREVLPHIG